MEKEQVNQKVSIHYIFWYFTFFSIIGLLIETLYCYTTTGIYESRKGLLWGPFCPVYGVGATILIVLLQKYKDHPLPLFIAGTILGGIIEYVLSFGLEALYGTRFWDYSYLQFDLNGRICFTYSLFWGILSFLLIQFITPKLNQFLDKFSHTIFRPLEFFLFCFLLVDVFFTIWGISVFKKRAMEIYYKFPPCEPQNALIRLIENRCFSTEYMIKTFPNLRFRNEQKEEIFIRTVFEES